VGERGRRIKRKRRGRERAFEDEEGESARER
jgi:hypothetical protein